MERDPYWIVGIKRAHKGSFESWTVSRNILITGTWESRALRLGSVAENTVYTSTKVPMISAASPVPRLYPG